MPLEKATAEDVRQMKARLRERQEERRLEADINEAISIVRNRKPQEAAHPEQNDKKKGPPEAYRRNITAGFVAVSILNAILSNWLFLLVLGMAVFSAAAVI